jgi:hypothetical protein
MLGGMVSSDADPDGITAEVKSFPPESLGLAQLWTDVDKILLVQEGFAAGQVEDLIRKNGFRGGHNGNVDNRPGTE